MKGNNSNQPHGGPSEKPNIDPLSNPEAFINEINKLTHQGGSTPHHQILDQLLGKITPIDFRELGRIPENIKLKDYHFRIIAVEHLLSLAINNNWGLCQQHDFIYLFNGAYWNQLGIEKLKDFLGKAAEKMGVPEFRSKDHKFRDELVKQFIALSNLPKPVQDQNQILINLSNGTFEISATGIRLREFRREDFMTYQLPFNYDPEATAPMFVDYLNKVLPDIEKQKILSEYAGYIFIPTQGLKLEKSLFLYGEGANGKSVYFDILCNLLGTENVSHFSLKSLTDSKSYTRAEIANKLLNYASEIGDRMEVDTFKQLASGEPLEARIIYCRPFIMRQYSKLLFNCNNLPRGGEHSKAVNRRLILIHFDVVISESEQDKQLAQKIIEKELSGVFNWVLNGLNKLVEQKNFSECQAVQQSLAEYEKNTDSVNLFIEENQLVSSPSDYVLIKELYLDYRSFCNDDGYKPVHKSNFIKRLKGLNIVVDKKNIGNVAYLSKKPGNL